ncbi:hypothetical protein AgCh_012462 [Apium graveolens]
MTEDVLKWHLLQFGIIEAYITWDLHGEKSDWSAHYSIGTSSNNNANEDRNVYDAFEILRDVVGEQYQFENVEEDPNYEVFEFYNLVKNASIPLCPGNEEYTKLSFVMKLLHFKNRQGCSQNGFDELLELIGSVLPKPHTLPKTYKEVKNMVKELNLGYEKIDACESDCMLYYKTDADKLCRDICGVDQYKKWKDIKSPLIAKKTLRYFPLTPKLKRLYMSKHTAEYMRWYKNRDVIEGQITHPADGDEWKRFDKEFPSFANKVRIFMLGLATDGFEPFHNKHSRKYSVWLVFIVVYNLPPSMCMKDQFIFMPLIIPGDRNPAKDLNVYLRPLIDELKILWDRVVTVSGWSTHGKMSCPVCVADVKAFQLKHGEKASFYGTSRVFLKPNDPLRRNYKYGSRETKAVTSQYSAIFWELPYWEKLSLRHFLDVMHIEKNVFDNLFYTVLDDGDKSKDNAKSRKDCKHLGVRKELWIRDDDSKPVAPYVLTQENVKKLCKWVDELKLPDGWNSNLSQSVEFKKGQFKGLKSHDGHVFLQKLMPILAHDLLPSKVSEGIIELCNLFKSLCSTTLTREDLDKMEADIVHILCKLELIFPPRFFDTMEHLPIHLATLCKLGGPVQYRWMYPFERYLGGVGIKARGKPNRSCKENHKPEVFSRADEEVVVVRKEVFEEEKKVEEEEEKVEEPVLVEMAGSITIWEDLAQKFLTKFFPMTKTAAIRNALTQFAQQPGESLCEAWDRYKEMLRKFPHHGMPDWMIINYFYNGLGATSRPMLDAASRGALWAKSYGKAYELIELMAANEYQNPSQRPTQGKITGIQELDAATAIAAQLKALTIKVDTLANHGVNQIASVCKLCAGAHEYDQCTIFSESAQFVSNFQRSQQPVPATYHPNNRNHPKFRQQLQLQQANEKSELEELKLMCKSQAVSIKTLENQIGQIANALLHRQPGTLPSDTEVPGRKEAKEHVILTVRKNGDDFYSLEELEQLEDESMALIIKRFSNVRFKRNPKFKYKSNYNRFQKGGSSSSNTSSGGYKTGMVDRSTIRCFNCNELGHFVTECRKPKQFRKNSYDSNQKSKSERAYLAKGRSWDDTDSEDEEVGNLALMASDANTSSSRKEVKFTDAELVYHLGGSLDCARRDNELLNQQIKDLEKEVNELRLVHINQDKLKEQVSFLENRVDCYRKLETILIDKITGLEAKVKAYFNSCSKSKKFYNKQAINQTSGIGYDYNAAIGKLGINSPPHVCAKGREVPHVLKGVDEPLYKESIAEPFDETSFIIQEKIRAEDNANEKAISKSSVSKVPVKVVKATETNSDTYELDNTNAMSTMHKLPIVNPSHKACGVPDCMSCAFNLMYAYFNGKHVSNDKTTPRQHVNNRKHDRSKTCA